MCPTCQDTKKVALPEPYEFVKIPCQDCTKKPWVKTTKEQMENGYEYYCAELERDRQANWLWEQQNKRPEGWLD